MLCMYKGSKRPIPRYERDSELLQWTLQHIDGLNARSILRLAEGIAMGLSQASEWPEGGQCKLTLNFIFMRTSYMCVASPDALMQIFPLIIKNFFRKHGCLFFLRACVSGVPLIMIHLWRNPLSSITAWISSEISLKLDIFAMLTLSISNSHSSQQWQSAHCQSKSYMSVPNQSIECSAKKSILLSTHITISFENGSLEED